MKSPNSRSTRKKVIKPVGGNTPAAAFPVAASAPGPNKKETGGTRKKGAKHTPFWRRLFH